MEFDYSLETISPTLTPTLTIGGTGSLTIPVGTSAAEPTGVTGTMRYDTDLNKFRFYTTSWNNIATEGYVASNFQPLDSDLTALANTSTTGLYVVTGAGTSTTRTLTAPAAGITVSNGNGVAGNPTLSLANDLSALEALASTGYAVRTATDTWAQRSIVAGSSKLSVTNGDGVAGNTSVDVVEANLTLNNIGGTLSIAKGGTGLTGAGTANQMFGMNAAATAPEYKTLVAGTGLSILHAPGQITFANTGVTSVAATVPAAGITVSGSPITTTGTLAFNLANDLAALEGLASTGFATRTATDIWAQRTLTSGSSKLSLTNGDGVAGNPTFDVVEGNLTLNNIGGTLGIAKGGTNLTTLGTANQVLGVNAAATSLEYKSLVAGTGISIGQGAGAVTINNTGVTSVAASAPSAGFTITGSPITTTGTLTFTLANDLAAVEGLAGTGYAVRTAADTWAQRSFAAASSKVAITNGDGVSGNTTVDVVEANLSLNNIGGTLSVAKGGTNLTAVGSANQVMGVNAAGTALEYKTIAAGTGITVAHTANTVTITNNSKSIAQLIPSAITAATGSTTIPVDNTPPLNTEGTQVWSGTITPTATTSTVRIEVCTNVGVDANQAFVTVALFRGTTCIAVKSAAAIGAGLASAVQQAASLNLCFYDTPATTSAVTYSVRVGSSTGNWYFGRSAVATYNGLASGQVVLTEFRA